MAYHRVLFKSSEGGSPTFSRTTSMFPVLKMSPKAAPRRDFRGMSCKPASFETSSNVHPYCCGEAEAVHGTGGPNPRYPPGGTHGRWPPKYPARCPVIHVKEGRTQPNIWITGLADSGSPTHVVESLFAHVAIQRIGLLFKVRDKKTQAPAVGRSRPNRFPYFQVSMPSPLNATPESKPTSVKVPS